MNLFLNRKRLNKVAESKRSKSNKRMAFLSALTCCFVLFSVSLAMIITELGSEAAARGEYDSLREMVPRATHTLTIHTPIPNADTPPDNAGGAGEPAQGGEPIEEEKPSELQLAMLELYAINNEFVGWLNIGGMIEYPVVRGSDNTKYLDRTFSGEDNPAGAIFMDYRNKQGFDETICIIYGHMMRGGSMFSQLHMFRDREFLAENPHLEITTLDGTVLQYEIFAARVVNETNSAFTASFTDSARAIAGFPNAPSGAERFLLLSTCTAYDEERLLVYAAAVELGS